MHPDTNTHWLTTIERQQERYALGELTYACKVVSPRKAKQRSRSDLVVAYVVFLF